MMARRFCFGLFVLLAFGLSPAAWAADHFSPQGLTLQGTILNSSGQPEEATSVTFTIQVMSPSATGCLLYSETQTLNMSASGGAFALTIGAGNRSGSGFQATSTLPQVFSNSSSVINSLTCTVGGVTSYTPSTNDSRNVVITFNDGSGPQTFTQALVVESAPYALFADQATTLQGLDATGFIQTNTTTTQTAVDAMLANTKFMTFAGGSNFNFVSQNSNSTEPVPQATGTPTALTAGEMWYDSANNVMKYYNGTSVQTVGTGGSSLSNVTAGTGLTPAGVIASNSTLAVNVGTGPNQIVQLGSTSKLPAVDGSQLTNIASALATSSVTTTGTITAANLSSTTDSTNNLRLYNGATNYVTLKASGSLSSNPVLTLPTGVGSANQILYTDGTGVLSWGYMGITGIRSTVGGNAQFFPLNCTSAQTLTYQAPTDTFVCTNIAVGASSFASQNQATVLAAPTAANGTPTFRSLATTDLPSAVILNGGNTTGATMTIGSKDAEDLNIVTNNQNVVTVKANGYVGIGTTSPSQWLEVNGGAQVDGTLTLNNGEYNYNWSNTVYTPTGAVLNGASGPNLIVSNPNSGAGTGAFLALQPENNGSGTGAYIGAIQPASGYAAPIVIGQVTGASGAYTERLRIDTTGKLGIGTTAPKTSLDLSANTDALALPVGTTAQEPTGGALTAGEIRYNTTTAAVEFYNGSAWTTLSSGGGGSYLAASGGTLTGGLTISTGGETITAGGLTVSAGGINANNSGITNAGTISGASSVTAASTGNLALGNTTDGTSLQIQDIGSTGADYVTIKGSAAAGTPNIGTAGSDANVSMALSSKGSSSLIYFQPGGNNVMQVSGGQAGLFVPMSISNTNANTTTALAATSVGTGYAGTFMGGYVGIGTTGPSYPLTVTSSNATTTALFSNSSSTSTGAAVQNTNPSGYSMFGFIDSSGANQGGVGYANTSASAMPGTVVLGSSNGNSVNLYTSNAPRLTVSGTGNVGIGTTAPAAQLDVTGTPSGGTVLAAAFRGNPGAAGAANYTNILIDNTYGAGDMKAGVSFAASGVKKWDLSSDPWGNGSQNFGIYNEVNSTWPFWINSTGQIGLGNNINPGAGLDVGLAGTTLGTMRLEGNTSGYVQIQPSAAAGSWTMTLPPAAPSTNGYVLSSTTAGVTSWVAAGGSTGNYSFSGNNLTTAAGDSMTIIPGAASSATSVGNTVTITGGAGGTTSGAGGAININGGVPASGTGGAINIAAANGVGTNQNGGNVTITSGAATGSGSSGNISLMGGYVGIGTTAPTTKLDVEGTGNILFNAGDVGIGTGTLPLTDSLDIARNSNYTSTNGGGAINIFDPTTTYGMFMGEDTTHGAAFIQAWTSSWNYPLTLQPDGGNLGVGTPNPQSKLDVSGGVSIGSYAGVTAAPSNGLIVSGNVGIGTTTPASDAALAINGHVQIQQTTAPTAAVGPALGSGGTACTLTHANDVAGQISIETGTSGWTTGVGCTITFNKAYAVAPIVTITPTNAVAASVAYTMLIYVSSTTTTFVMNVGTPATSQAIGTWNYHVIETQ